MGPGSQVGSVLGIHRLHLISRGNKATNHWDLSTWHQLDAKGQSPGAAGGDGLTLPENALSPVQVDPGGGGRLPRDRAGGRECSLVWESGGEAQLCLFPLLAPVS